MFTELRRRWFGICGHHCRGYWCGLWRGHAGNHVAEGLTWDVWISDSQLIRKAVLTAPDPDKIDRSFLRNRLSDGENRVVDLTVCNVLADGREAAMQAATPEERMKIMADHLWKQVENSGSGYTFGKAHAVALNYRLTEQLNRQLAELAGSVEPEKPAEPKQELLPWDRLSPRAKMYLSAGAMTMWAAAFVFVTYWCVIRPH